MDEYLVEQLNLFIYIPTYNRPRALMEQLNSLAPQIEKYAGRVRVLINDNASPGDCYLEHIEKFSSKYIEFRSNGANVGANANIELGFIFAKPSEALWILSDNDIVASNAVEYLLPHLTDDFDLICQRPEISSKEDVIYEWASGWVEPLCSHTGLISSDIYNVKKFATYADMGFYYHNCSFPHLAVILAFAKALSKVKFRLLPRLFVSRDDLRNQMVEYELSYIGMPLLSDIMPREHASTFCWGWLQQYWKQLFWYRKQHPAIFRQTIALLKNHGPQFINALSQIESMNVPAKPCSDKKWSE